VSDRIDFAAGFLLVIAACMCLNASMNFIVNNLSEIEDRPIVPILTKEERRILCN
jgi:hypothetical protein